MFPKIRPRRLRGSQPLRDIVAETHLSINDLVYPVFVKEGPTSPIKSMPGQYQHSLKDIGSVAVKAQEAGIKSLLLFGIPKYKDSMATSAFEQNGVVQKGVKAIKDEADDIFVMTDVCTCQYTNSGHCGIVENGKVINDKSLPILSKIALSHAKAGADAVAPSDMLDGRVGAIRKTLDDNSYNDIPIVSYSAKYASSYYGPFREACNSAPQQGDRKTYQMDYHNAREALKEVELDIAEGADIVMVKPALCYLDIICKVKEATNVPVMAYNVSGEYAMIKHAGAAGLVDERSMVLETLTSIKRAGADIIATYFALDYAGDLI
ncbi:MAG: porphobilinogen synthase [Candidatus Methanofastidiosia archaeon]